MPLAMTAASMRLSVLVTLIGRVSDIRPVNFLGIKKRTPQLKPGGGGCPLSKALRTSRRIGAASGRTARQTAKGMPSGPEAESLEVLIECSMSVRVGREQRSGLTFLE